MLAMASPARPIGGSTQQEVPGSSDTDGELNAQVPHKRRKNLQNAAQYPSTSYVVSFSGEELDEKLEQEEEEYVRVVMAKSVAMTGGARSDPLRNTVEWARHLAESPHSVLLDVKNYDEDVRRAKQVLARLRIFRQEDLLQRRKGLRPASLRSLNLIPASSYSQHHPQVSDGAVAGEAYPVRSSRVGTQFQATLPGLRRGPAPASSSSAGDAEEPTRVWPAQGDHSAWKAGEARRAAAHLTDPVDYGWSEEEYAAFKRALDRCGPISAPDRWAGDPKHYDPFRDIARWMAKDLGEARVSGRQVAAFYFQVYEVVKLDR